MQVFKALEALELVEVQIKVNYGSENWPWRPDLLVALRGQHRRLVRVVYLDPQRKGEKCDAHWCALMWKSEPGQTTWCRGTMPFTTYWGMDSGELEGYI